MKNVREYLITRLKNNYMIYADTSINTIFIDHHKWHNRSTKYTSVMIL